MASKTRFVISACLVVALAGLLFTMGRPVSVSAKKNTPVDETAVNAFQLVVQYQFGPGTTCTTDTGYCFATGHFIVPQGKRFVIENLSAVVSYPTTSLDTLAERFSLATQVSNTVCFHSFPFDRVQTVAGTSRTYYYANKSVRVYADPAIGFPKIDLANITGLGPVFTHDKGEANFIVSGYLVDLP